MGRRVVQGSVQWTGGVILCVAPIEEQTVTFSSVKPFGVKNDRPNFGINHSIFLTKRNHLIHALQLHAKIRRSCCLTSIETIQAMSFYLI